MIDRIKDYLKSQLSYVYCDTCDGKYCEECDRKSMNWGISEDYAEALANKIVSMIKEE